MIVSSLLFALMGAAVQDAGRTSPNEVVVFLRSALGLVTLLPFLWRLGPAGLRTVRWRGHVVRAVFGLGAMYCFFACLRTLPLPEALLLNYSTPLFLPFFERTWSREPVPRAVWPALVLGFMGVLVILRPGSALFQPAAVLGVVAALSGALAQVGVRRLTQSEPTPRIVFWFAALAALFSAPPAALVWRPLSAREWLVFLAVGALATGGQLFLTRAYGWAPAAQVGPFMYANVVFAALIDWLLHTHVPDLRFVAGAALVVSGGVLTLRTLGRPAAPADEPAAASDDLSSPAQEAACER